MKRRTIISLLLVLAMLMGLFPTAALAAGSGTTYECESLTVTPQGNWGIAESRTTNDKDCSGGKFYFLQVPGTNGASWEEVKDNSASFSLGDVDAGTYQVYIHTKDNTDRGIYQFSVGGTSLGAPLDMYVPESSYTGSYGSYVEHDLGTLTHEGGALTIDAVLTGQNENATSKYGMVVDYFRLVKEGGEVDPPEPEDPDTIHMSFDGETLVGEGVTMSDGWSKSGLTGSTSDVGSVYSGTVGEYVQFQPAKMEEGWYEVFFWNIANGQGTMKMTATISADGGEENVKPAAVTADGWTSLGAFYFAGTGDESLTLTITTAGTHSRVADVKFVKTEDPGYQTVIWNNEDKVFSASGEWTETAGLGQNSSAVKRTEDTAAIATWADYPPKTGNFGLYYWNPAAQDGETRAPLRFSVSSQDGNWRFSLDPNENQGGWVKLGTVAASAGTMMTITMSLTGAGTAYADAIKIVETNASPDEEYTPGAGSNTDPAVIVNQLGYDIGRSKRATAANIPGGTPFQVINAETGQVDYTGTVEEAYGGEGDSAVTGGIIDFTELEPDETTTYYITCYGADSYQFQIGKNLMYQSTVQQALQFMEETRQDYRVGASTGYAWRDSHQFSFELNSLVLQYMANPAAYDNLTGGISDADQCVYPELRTQGEDEPDIVWLIKFGAMRYYDLGANQKVKLHILIKEQLAYFLYVYPYISKWVDREFYENVRDYTIAQWGVNSCNKQWYPVDNTNHDLYALQTAFGGLKGSQPPGHSIIPNLMMYEVALRDGLGEDVAQKFFDAAYINCEYLVSDDFDITDPYYNKGQRMSEHVTMEGLAYFLEMYPDEAPAGLLETITEWAKANVARTDNLWDIRMAVAPSDLDKGYTFHNPKFNDEQKKIKQVYWTGAAYANADDQSGYLNGGAPKNEPGNQGGLQAIAYAAARVIDDPVLQAELKEMGVSAIDDLLGRNPTGRAAFYHFTRDFEGADLGWYMQHQGGFGALEGCTAVIDANAPELTYPYAPENYNKGYTEGWVAYNTAWNVSLAYSSADATDLSVSKTSGKSGEEITITLDAPLNLDDAVVETGYVWVTDASGKTEQVAVTENAAAGTEFTGTYTLSNSTPYITISYGIGLFEQSVKVNVDDFQYVDVESVTVTGGRDLAVGEKLQLTAEVKPDNATIKDVTWTSSDDTVLTVSASGLVTALKEGTATITATGFGDVEGTCSITVTAAAPASLTVEAPETLSLFDGTGKAKVTSVVYTDGTTVTENLPDVTFTSDNEAVLTVSADGTLTPVDAGQATVTATAEAGGRTITGSAVVTVTAEKSWDLLELSENGKMTTSGGATTTVITDHSLDVDRLKLTGNNQGGTVAFDLGEMPAGTYEITLNSKFYSSYGTWSFEVNGQVVGETIDFNDSGKNGSYYDVTLGEVTLEEAGNVTISFISGNGKDLVPVTLTLEKVEPPTLREVTITDVTRDGETVTVTGTSVNLEGLKVEVIVDGDLDQRYVAETLDEAGNWKCVFTLPADGTYVIQASIRDYSDFSQIIQTVPDDNYFEVEGREVWGATVTEGPDGLYYMIFSTWHNTQGFSNDWAVYSELGYAVSTSPDGPFVYQGLALDANYTNTTNTEPVYWEGVGDLEVFHNPTLMHSEKDGKYYLYFMGTNASEGGYTYSYGRNHQRIGVAVADTPAGPWTVYDKPVIDVREGMFDSLLTSNPSVTEVKNADGTYTYYTVYKGVSNLSGKDVVVSGCGYSDSPFGPFTRSEEAIMQNPTDGWSVEDCFLWSSNGKFYALAKDFKNYFTGVTGYPYSYALFESSDGMTDWAVSENALAFVTEIPWESGAQKVTNLERAQVYLEDGIPVLLCCATTKDGQSPYSGHAPYNVQIPLLGVVLAEDSETLTVTGLGDGTVDKTELKEDIAQAEQAGETLYTEEDWAELQSSLAAARRIADDPSATEEDVAFYMAELEEKLENQMDPSEVPFNIVLNKPAEGTNTYTHSAAGEPVSGYEPDKAVDGNASTRWATQEAYTESVLTVDLEGTYRIDSFSITQYKGSQDGMNSRIKTYTLEYFDGNEWKAFASGTADSTVIEGTLDQPVYGEKVRLVLGNDSSLAPSILEFEVYGVVYEEETEVPTVATYRVKVEAAEHGTVKASPIWAWAGRKVQLTIQPDEGYEVDTVSVTTSGGETVAVSNNAFTMPRSAVTVRVTFKAAEKTPLFPDVPVDAWYSDAVAWGVEQGVMQGVSGGLFDPDGAVTRATVWTVLARMAGEETDGGESWYAKAQAWAEAEGISDGTHPEGTITREQLAVMLYRYSGSPETAADLSGYPDSGDVSGWAADAMAWAAETGLITGGDGGKLMPGAGTDRAQLATILMRFASLTEQTR